MVRKIRGNVLPYVVAVLVIVAFAAQYVFNAFKVTNEATRMQNAADAAAYSVATVFAQSNNFVALSNRSLVANQVTMAQVVTMVSWTRMTSTMASTVNDIGQYIPYVSVVTNYINQIAQNARGVVESIAPAITRTVAAYIRSISYIQKIAVPLVSVIAQDIMSEVVESNDADIDYSFATVSLLNDTAVHLSALYGQNDCRGEANKVRDGGNVNKETVSRCRQFRNVTMASRDEFSSNRTYRFTFPGMPEKIILPGTPAVAVSGVPLYSTLTIERSGSTVMGGDTPDVQNSTPFTTWSAIDAISIHAETRYLDWKGSVKSTGHKERVKLGVGHAYVGNECSKCHHVIHEGTSYWNKNPRGSACTDPDIERGYGGGSKSQNSGAFKLMDVTALNCYELSNEFDSDVSQGTEQGVGLTPFFNLKKEGYVNETDHAFIYLRKERGKLKTYRKILATSDNLSLEREKGAQNDSLHGASSAAIYFKRSNDKWIRAESQRSDGRVEYSNAYNPFWEARLDKIDIGESVSLNALKEL
ncbi:pilus assembly protein TadG-related protein [uncultured Zhongshania sp.]|uniref:pilus assembly protein TadG-related protein n=1 Tax=uncultured Zhongshania sp. TaxID=1642288 RepID=UPI0025CC3509|nr:pilus assembly protein TadG-related protein [uncultured Zhongshania sp.]